MSQFEKSFEELLSELPDPRRMGHKGLPNEISCFIAIAGFEPRCLAAARKLVDAGWKTRQTVCVSYSDKTIGVPNNEYLPSLLEYLSQLSIEEECGELEHDDHDLTEDFGNSITNYLLKRGIDLADPTTHIAIDVTVGSSRLLLEGLISLFRSNAKVTIVYSEASIYRPSFDEYLEYLMECRVRNIDTPEFLTHGVDKVEVLKTIPGMAGDPRPSYLVLFPSFAYTRASAVVEELSPSRVQWIFGIPHLIRNRWRMDAQKKYHDALIDHSHRHCYVSTFDYRETLEVLERIFVKRSVDFSVMVASLGSKMQKVGQVIFHMLRPEAAAVVSIPKSWDPDRFSSGETLDVYAISFDSFAKLRRDLQKTKTLKT